MCRVALVASKGVLQQECWQEPSLTVLWPWLPGMCLSRRVPARRVSCTPGLSVGLCCLDTPGRLASLTRLPRLPSSPQKPYFPAGRAQLAFAEWHTCRVVGGTPQSVLLLPSR